MIPHPDANFIFGAHGMALFGARELIGDRVFIFVLLKT